MKKILLTAVASLALLTSCDLDINENPNYPSNGDVTSTLIFPSVENSIAACVGDQMFNYSGFFVQYFDQNPTANQYNDLAELNLNESSNLFDRCYRNLYAGALADIDEIVNRTDITSADFFACVVLRTYAFQLLVDNLSKCPYSEALKGTDVTMPKWDEGKDVYEDLLKELDGAESGIGSSVMTLTDPMLNKDIKAWKQFANSLRLRMLLRLHEGGIDKSADIKALVNVDEFITSDVTYDVYSPIEGQFNPWYAGYYSLGTKNHCASYPIISYMNATNDPRIAYTFAPRSKDNTYVGQIPGAKTVESGWLGLTTSTYQDNMVSGVNYNNFKDAPVYLMTVAEVEFLKAEVETRFNNNFDAANTAYVKAIKADFASRGVSGVDAFLESSGIKLEKAAGDYTTLRKIYMQKWVALLMRDHMEAWTEARRTDVPAVSSASGEQIIKDFANSGYSAGDLIVPAVNYIIKGGVALRVPYPQVARTSNTNVPEAQLLSDKVFWDIK